MFFDNYARIYLQTLNFFKQNILKWNFKFINIFLKKIIQSLINFNTNQLNKDKKNQWRSNDKLNLA